MSEAFDFNDAIDPSQNTKDFLPEGEYDFEVIKLEKIHENNYGKLGAVNLAAVTLVCSSGETRGTVVERIPLHAKMIWKICQFFECIGLRDKGDKGVFVPPWGQVVGATGRCSIKVNEFTTKRGEQAKDSRIGSFIVPSEQASQPEQQYESLPF